MKAASTSTEFRTWMCLICGYIYDEAAGAPEEGIAPCTRWSDVPVDWTCPECGARKEDFEMVEI
jgi:rubredoxin